MALDHGIGVRIPASQPKDSMTEPGAKPGLGKRLLFGAVMLGMVALVTEAASFAVAAYVASRGDVIDFRPVLRRRLRAPADVRRPIARVYRELYDPELGWVYKR